VGDRVTDEEIDDIIEKVLRGGLQRGTLRQQTQLQQLGIKALLIIIQKKIKMTAITDGIERSIEIEGLIDLLVIAGLDINGRNEDGNTILIYAADNGDAPLVKCLLKHGADSTLRNLNGVSAFIAGIYSGNGEVLYTLLPHESKASLNYVDREGNTALSITARREWISLEHAIIMRGGIIPGFKIEEGTTPSQMRTKFLHSLQQKGPLLTDDSSIPKAMLANCFVENGGADFPIDYLEYLSLNPDLRTLMVLVIQASGANQSKQFFFEQRHNKTFLFSDSSDSPENAGGCFNQKTKNIFCFYEDIMSIQTISYFFHEAMHLAMDFVYENNSRPYRKEDSKKKETFDEVLHETKNILDCMKPDEMPNWERSAYYSLYSVYTAYLEDKRAAELIVKIPEILVKIGIKRGIAWLNQFKALMTYYRDVVIPDMQARCKNVAYEEKQVPLTPVDIVMKMIYEQNFNFFIYEKKIEVYGKLTADEWKKIKKTALFFQQDLALIDKFEACCKAMCANEKRKRDIHLEWAKNRGNLSVTQLEQMTRELEGSRGDPRLIESFKHYLENRRILDKFWLDPNNDKHLRYWSTQVTWGGGCDYKEHRIPHTIAKIFKMVEKISLTSTPHYELLEEIHKIRMQDSGSRMSFFGLSGRSRMMEELRTLPDESFLLSFSPGGNRAGM
jgi:hypothetical protein